MWLVEIRIPTFLLREQAKKVKSSLHFETVSTGR